MALSKNEKIQEEDQMKTTAHDTTTDVDRVGNVFGYELNSWRDPGKRSTMSLTTVSLRSTQPKNASAAAIMTRIAGNKAIKLK